jgi:hypothetical protein
VIEAPPFDVGTAHLSVIPVPVDFAVRFRGALGMVRGVADSEFDSGPDPTEFVACTVNE